MKAVLQALAFLAALTGPALAADNHVTVTYTGNEGFLIEGGGQKVLIDSLYQNAGEYVSLPAADFAHAIAGDKPFDGIGLLLVTHRDGDHFDPKFAIEYLQRHAAVRLAANTQAVDRMRSLPGFADVQKQIKEITLAPGNAETFTLNGIAVEALALDHAHAPGKAPHSQNTAYILTVGGVRLLHTGDALLAQNLAMLGTYPFERKHVDIAFLLQDDLSPETKKLVVERIQPRKIVAMHLPEGQVEAERKHILAVWPDAVTFEKPMDKVVLP